MKWKEFKKLAEDAGITDDMEINWIEVNNFTLWTNVKIQTRKMVKG